MRSIRCAEKIENGLAVLRVRLLHDQIDQEVSPLAILALTALAAHAGGIAMPHHLSGFVDGDGNAQRPVQLAKSG